MQNSHATAFPIVILFFNIMIELVPSYVSLSFFFLSPAISLQTSSHLLFAIVNNAFPTEIAVDTSSGSNPPWQKRMADRIKTANLSGLQTRSPSRTLSRERAGDKLEELPLTAPAETPVQLTLDDVVSLALENNRTVKNAYLDRIVQQRDLEVAESKFVPEFAPQFSISAERDDLEDIATNREELELSTSLSSLIPTGGEISLDFTVSRQFQNTTGSGNNGDETIDDRNLQLNFNQPLLRGFGINVNRASIEIARLTERANILSLKATLIDTVTDAIQGYRALLRTQERLKIERRSLESANRQLELTQALVDAGRRPRVEIVEAEANVANREVNVLTAENELRAAILNLIEILDIERSPEIVATEIPSIEELAPPKLDELMKISLANNPDYLRSLIDVETAQLNLLLAEDDIRWDLDLDIGYDLDTGNRIDRRTNLRAGLTLSRELGRQQLEQKQAVNRSQIDLEKAKNDLEERRETLEIEIKNISRDVRVNFRQVELARRARELSEQQLENQREKLRLGVEGARLIDVLDFEDRLVEAENRELNAIIDYLNELTRLEQTLGITLEQWNVNINSN